MTGLVADDDIQISNGPKRGEPKFYALLHWVLIDLGIEKLFEKNENDLYPASLVKNFAENKYGFKNGQSFYRCFKDLDITNKTAIARTYGKSYKEKIIGISNNDARVISYLKKFPN